MFEIRFNINLIEVFFGVVINVYPQDQQQDLMQILPIATYSQ